LESKRRQVLSDKYGLPSGEALDFGSLHPFPARFEVVVLVIEVSCPFA
jgi:hypothetical protein